MKNGMQDLRDHLFATLEALRDPDKPMELDRAEQIAKTAQVLVNSAKVEVDFLKVAGAHGSQMKGTGFMEPKPQLPMADIPRLTRAK